MIRAGLSGLNSDTGKRSPILKGGHWILGKTNAYFKCSGTEKGDYFLPFVSIPTDNGYWTIGTHSIDDSFVLQFWDNLQSKPFQIKLKKPSTEGYFDIKSS